MPFFRKWKNHYGHKKFKSDDIIEAEDWGLQKPVSNKEHNFNNFESLKLDVDCIEAKEDKDGIDGGDNKNLSADYDIKYLGCTPIETKRSENATSEAIKTVIANSKAGGRKLKSQKRVKLNVSEEGIIVIDHASQERMMRFSIYKISYCSIDAAHDHVFSFVSSETDPLTEQEKLSCHVFYCGKRKIAHEITLMVARCFEHAYQHWRDLVVQHQIKSCDKKSEASEKRETVVSEFEHKSEKQASNGNLLIDLAGTDSNAREFLQDSWVSFDEDIRDGLMAY